MAVKLHRCGGMPGSRWTATPAGGSRRRWATRPGWSTSWSSTPPSRARQAQGVHLQLTGQDRLPAIELEDGTVIREESAALVARIREGRLAA